MICITNMSICLRRNCPKKKKINKNKQFISDEDRFKNIMDKLRALMNDMSLEQDDLIEKVEKIRVKENSFIKSMGKLIEVEILVGGI